jgi:hypothetical protein
VDDTDGLVQNLQALDISSGSDRERHARLISLLRSMIADLLKDTPDTDESKEVSKENGHDTKTNLYPSVVAY